MQPITIFLRCKPNGNPDIRIVIDIDQGNVDFEDSRQSDSNNSSSFRTSFAHVFGTSANQADIFTKVAEPIVNKLFEGFNGTIFAYGQTGSGKTHTLTGSVDVYQNRGIIPRCVQQIFKVIKSDTTKTCKVWLRFPGRGTVAR
jgi:predicted choloylglycine hydrolase